MCNNRGTASVLYLLFTGIVPVIVLVAGGGRGSWNVCSVCVMTEVL